MNFASSSRTTLNRVTTLVHGTLMDTASGSTSILLCYDGHPRLCLRTPLSKAAPRPCSAVPSAPLFTNRGSLIAYLTAYSSFHRVITVFNFYLAYPNYVKLSRQYFSVKFFHSFYPVFLRQWCRFSIAPPPFIGFLLYFSLYFPPFSCTLCTSFHAYSCENLKSTCACLHLPMMLYLFQGRVTNLHPAKSLLSDEMKLERMYLNYERF